MTRFPQRIDAQTFPQRIDENNTSQASEFPQRVDGDSTFNTQEKGPPSGLREFIQRPEVKESLVNAGVDPDNISPIQALQSGAVEAYIHNVREYAYSLPPGSDERVAAVQSIAGLRNDLQKFKSQVESAKQAGVSREAFLRATSTIGGAQVGALEQEATRILGGRVGGAALRNLATGAEQLGGTITSLHARASSYINPEDALVPFQVAQDANLQAQVTKAIDRKEGLQDVFGEQGAQAFQGATRSLPTVYAGATVGGPNLVYALFGAQAYGQGLNEADEAGLGGLERHVYAGAKGALEITMTALMGKAGKQLGFRSLEEPMTPAARSAIRNLFTKSGVKDTLIKAFKNVAGAGSEIFEEEVIDQGHQLTELIAGTRDEYDFRQTHMAGLTGLFSKTTADAFTGAYEAMNALQKQAPDVIAGVKAAEDAIETAGEGPIPRVPPSETSGVEGDPPPVTEPQAAPETAEEGTDPTVAQQLAQAEARTREEGVTGRGARKAKKFFETATPEMLEKASKPLSQKEFAEVTGLKKTSEPFREAFRHTLEYYRSIPRTPAEGPESPKVVETKAEESTEDPEVAQELNTRDQKKLRNTQARHRGQRKAVRDLRQRVADSDRLQQKDLDDAVSLVEEALPHGPQRNRLTKKALKARNRKKFDGFAKDLEETIRKQEHRAAKAAFLRAIRFAKSNKFGDFAEDAVKGIDLKSKKSRERLKDLADYFEQNPDFPVPESVQKALRRLDQKPLDEMTPEEINDATEGLLTRVHQRRTENQFLNAKHQGFIDDTVSELAKEIEAAPPLDQTFRARGLAGFLPERFGPKLKEPRRKQASTDSPWLREFSSRPQDVLADMSERLADIVWDKTMVLPNHEFKKWENEFTDGMASVFQENNLPWDASTILGIRAPNVRGGQVELTSPLETWREETIELDGNEFSRDELILIAGQLRDAETRSDLRRFGFRWEKGDREVGPITDETEQRIVEFLGEPGMSIVNYIHEHNNTKLIDRANEASMRVNGHPLTTRKGHAPRPIIEEDSYDPNDPLGTQRRKVQAAVDSYSHLKQRTGKRGPVEIPAHVVGGIDFAIRHNSRMARYAAYLAPYRDAKIVLDRLKPQIEQYGGRDLFEGLQDSVARQVAPPMSRRDEMENLGNKILSSVKRGVIGLSAGAHVLSSIGLLTMAARYSGGGKRLLASIVDDARPSRSAELNEAMMRDSPVVASRYKDDNYLHEYAHGMVGQRSFFRPRPATEIVTRSIGEAEKIATRIKFAFARRVVEERGISRDDPNFNREAALELERIMYQTENSSEGLEYNGALKKAEDWGVMGRASAAFLNAASKHLSLITRGIRENKIGNSGLGKRLLAYGGAGLLVEAIIRDLISLEEVEGNWPERVSKRLVLGLPSMAPFIGPLLESFARRAMDMKVWPQDQNILFDTGRDLAMGMGEIADATIDAFANDPDFDPDQFWDGLKDVAETLPTAMGFPVRGAMNLGELAGDVGNED